MPRRPVSSKRSFSLGNYVIGRTIGQGTFGKVKLGTHVPTGEKVAIKILEKDKIKEPADVERVSREIKILKMMRHSNVVQLYEIIETHKDLYLIMEYASGGELFDYIVSKGKLQEKQACKFFQQLIAGVEFIHSMNVVHRDLKPENLLLDVNNEVKIVDFGLSNSYLPGCTLKTACGSPCYAAPEMIAGKSYHGLGADIWSSGIIMFAMICGYLPFEDQNTSKLYQKILNGDYKIPKWVSDEARDLLKKILNTNPRDRYTIEDIRKHPWFKITSLYFPPKIDQNIDEGILKGVEELGFDPEKTRQSVKSRKHNNLTTTYFLLLKKRLMTQPTKTPKPPQDPRPRRPETNQMAFRLDPKSHRRRDNSVNNGSVSPRTKASSVSPRSRDLRTKQIIMPKAPPEPPARPRVYKGRAARIRTPFRDIRKTLNSSVRQSPRIDIIMRRTFIQDVAV